MKTFLLMFSFFPTLSFAQTQAPIAWADLENGSTLTLQKSLTADETHAFPAGTEFVFDESQTLDPVPVEVFTLHLLHCTPQVNQTPVEMTMLDADYGFEWTAGCKASFYVEFKDLYRDSYFQALAR